MRDCFFFVDMAGSYTRETSYFPQEMILMVRDKNGLPQILYCGTGEMVFHAAGCQKPMFVNDVESRSDKQIANMFANALKNIDKTYEAVRRVNGKG